MSAMGHENVVSVYWAVCHCLILAGAYVGSLYVWRKRENRDHPETIKRRFISVFVVCCIAPIYLKKLVLPSYPEIFEEHTLWQWLGVKVNGLAIAILLPCLLTMILFMGPLMLQYLDGLVPLYLEPRYWLACVKNWTWLRNHIVAPFSEEFIFRACMLPMLVAAVGSRKSMFIAPLFFGVAHLHHAWEKVFTHGITLKCAAISALFQFSYTTIFGTYSAFLFLRTGHLAAPFVAHSFCNHMGFPAFNEVLSHRHPKRTFIALSYIVGLLLWIYLMWSATDPMWFANDVYTL